MAISRAKDGRLRWARQKELAFKDRKDCMMRKADQLFRRCGNPVCIILYESKHSDQAETWPSDSDEVTSAICNYKNAIASSLKNPKKVNLTLQDIKLGYNKWATTPRGKKVWEKEFPHGFISELPYQNLAAINEQIDATLRKIDDAMLRASANCCFQNLLVPSKVDSLEALMQQDMHTPTYDYLGQHGFGADQSANQIQMMSAYHSNTVNSNIVRMLMNDQFGDQNSNSNNSWLTSQNSDSLSNEVSNNQQLLLSANSFDQSGSGYGTLASDCSAEFSSINSCGKTDMFNWNAFYDQPQSAGEQMQMLSNAWDCYPQRNGDHPNSTYYELETGCNTDTFSSSFFDTLINTEFM